MKKVCDLILYHVNKEDAYKQQIDLEIKQLEEELHDHMKAYNDATQLLSTNNPRIHVKFQIFEKSMDKLQERKQTTTANNNKDSNNKENQANFIQHEGIYEGKHGFAQINRGRSDN